MSYINRSLTLFSRLLHLHALRRLSGDGVVHGWSRDASIVCTSDGFSSIDLTMDAIILATRLSVQWFRLNRFWAHNLSVWYVLWFLLTLNGLELGAWWALDGWGTVKFGWWSWSAAESAAPSMCWSQSGSHGLVVQILIALVVRMPLSPNASIFDLGFIIRFTELALDEFGWAWWWSYLWRLWTRRLWLEWQWFKTLNFTRLWRGDIGKQDDLIGHQNQSEKVSNEM